MKKDIELIEKEMILFSGEDKNRKVEKLNGDASIRRYYRVYDTENRFIACVGEDQKIHENFIQMTQLLEQCGVLVPKTYLWNGKNLIIQTDLGQTSFAVELAKKSNWEEVYQLYTKSIDLLLKLHEIDYQEKSIIFNKFDKEKLNQEVAMSRKFFLEKLLRVNEKKQEKIIGFFEQNNSFLEPFADTLSHRDYHSRNIMIKDNKLYMIDYQDARIGPAQYDLVSLLEDCYTSIDRNIKEELKNYYFKKASALGILDCDYLSFCNVYERVAMQRIFKALGSFAYLSIEFKKSNFLFYIAKAMEGLRHLCIKNQVDESVIEALLCDYYAS